MKILKNIFLVLFSCGLFIAIQCVATLGALINKINIEPEYGEKLLLSLENLDMNNLETYNDYLSLCFEIIPMTMFITSVLILIPIGIYLYKKKITILKKISLKQTIQLFSLAIVLNIIISAIVELLPSNITDNYTSTTGYLQELSFLPMLISVGLLAPIVEELFFRFLMVRKLKNKPILAIILPALLFGIVHGNLIQGSYAFILGVLFAYLYLKTDNLLVTILLHMGINSSSVLFSFLPLPITIFIIVLSFIIVIYSFIKGKKFNKNILKVILNMNIKIPKYIKDIKNSNLKQENNYSIIKKLVNDINCSLNPEIIVLGKENLNDLREPFVAYSNHRGLYDPILIISQMKNNLSFVLKKELAENKKIKDIATLTNSEFFGRTPKEDIHTIFKMIEYNKNGRNYLIFPEGTRNSTDELLEYKGGSFKIPQKNHCDILPIVLLNTENIFDKKSNNKKVIISILKPIHYEDYLNKSAIELSKMTQEIAQIELNKLKEKY